MRRHIINLRSWMAAVMALALTACSDDLYESVRSGDGEEDGIAFSVSVSEQDETLVGEGKTRAGLSAPKVNVHELPGVTAGLKVGGQTLPFIGIHQYAAQQYAKTRAAADLSSWEESARNKIATTEHFHDSLTLYGFTEKRALHTTGIRGLTIKKVRNWRTSLHWPYDSNWMQFFAISPAIDNVDVTATNYTDTPYNNGNFTPLQIHYNVPNDVSEQRDLLYGNSEVVNVQALDKQANLGQDNKEVALSFEHILTAVRFVQGKIPTHLRITKIELKGIVNEGIYNGTEWGSQNAGTGNYVLENLNYVPEQYEYANTQNVYIDNGNVMFLMPHTLSKTETMEITIEEIDPETKTGKGIFHIIKTDLDKDEWLKGHTFTYRITIGKVSENYYLAIDPEYVYVKFSQNPETAHFNVHSYQLYHDFSLSDKTDNTYNEDDAEDGNKVYKPIPWKVTGYSKDGETYYSPKDNEDDVREKFSWIDYSKNAAGRGDEVTPEAKDAKKMDGQIKLYPQSWVKNQENLTWHDANSEHNQSDKAGYSHKYNLLDFSTNNNASNEDLSIYRGGGKYARETANSYIVNRAGTYLIPLVYGNAIQAGSEVTLGNNAFVDHRGRTINSAWLEDQLKVDNSKHIHYEFPSTDYKEMAKILWIDQNAPATMTFSNVQITQLKGEEDEEPKLYLQFTVGGTLQPGNAVIAIYAHEFQPVYENDDENNEVTVYTDNGLYADPVWSWHIWVTDEIYQKNGILKTANLYSSKENYTADTPSEQLMPVNLGWVPQDDLYGFYEPREAWVNIHQVLPSTADESQQTEDAQFCIRQWAEQDQIQGGSTFYQWGRPVALPMVADVTTESTTEFNTGEQLQPSARRHVMTAEKETGSGIWSSTSTYFDLYAKSIDSRQKAIRYPQNMVWFQGTIKNMWWGTDDRNMWGGSTGSTTKTLYDPCPPGFCVPYSSFLANRLGDGTGKIDYQNASSRVGANIFTTPYPEGGRTIAASDEIWAVRKEPTTYFPATGYWSSGAADGMNVLIDGVTNVKEGGTADEDGAKSGENKIDNPSKGFWWTSNYSYSDNKTMGTYLYIDPGSGHILNILTDKSATTGMYLRPMLIETTTSSDPETPTP